MKIFSWNNAVNPERVELVFEQRNKAYGGYELRKDYTRRVVLALIISIVGIGLLVAIPKIISVLSKQDFTTKESMTDVLVMLEPPPIDKNTPPPPPVIPPPPVQQTIKFTPPKVVKDEEVDEPPPTQEEIKDVQVSTQTVEGDKDIIDLPPENPVVGDDEGKIFTVVEEMPGFPGGEGKLFEYLQKNIKYPPVARENGIQGRVYVTFVVDKEGKIRDAKILRGIGGGCDEEALRVVRSMPDWKAGRQNGRSVQVQYNLPVNFTLK
ncbi:MAG: energy transducer TonB [Bacteroidetes bacterium]|nr:MAG: energy transducer TonB [Bacteroidota bacterium]